MVGRGALRVWGASLSLFVFGSVGVWGGIDRVERVERVERQACAWRTEQRGGGDVVKHRRDHQC
jgi:hypothetical protein